MKDSYLAQFLWKIPELYRYPNKWYKEYNVKKGLQK